ncbi:S1 RNA-binding domain-containing protein [Leptotrichia sp. OH3620_COT-345]|uniref:S1 RNA-binding domain-containing protein n=1 Tax=Leptotrichia sp. OH3620_COT-345 TaxID=2491048 RepID=UPI000F64A3B7|nr:S1 RNA-binding domain-containing protein [Leptotrichia sp. OH3620_COT-345]RRD37927.1 S1 RNA-binding domain-containing protein [Leptotrichia sp. OH3620_COT-345]
MSEFNDLFEKMLDDYLPEEKKAGDVIEAVIIRKDNDFAYLDLNDKQEGRILIKEVEDFNVGDTIEVKILRKDEENIIVSKFLLDKAKEFASLIEGEIVTGTVFKKIKGGYSVKVGKNEGFLPFSLSAFERENDHIGEKFKFILKEKTRNSFTLSRSDLVKKEEEDYLRSLNINDIITGKIKEILDFGIIVDLGHTTGFIHISEISWDQINDLVGKFSIGDEVKAKVIEKDEEKRKVKLSIKKLEEDPWISFSEAHNIDDIVDVTVKEVLDFGLIVDIEKIKGFIHISELAWNNTAKALKNYKEGDKFKAKIINLENDKKNVKLSVKQLTENPWNRVKEKYKIGDILEKPVLEIFEFGLLIELEKDIDGLLHVSDLAYRRVSNLGSKFKVGEIVKFKIISFNDEKNRISLSVKALLDDLWNKMEDYYNVGDVVKGKVVNVQEYGIFLEIKEGIEVFIYKNEFSWDKNEEMEFKKGDEIELKITSIDKKDKRIGGSLKQLTISPWKEAAGQYRIGNKVKVPIVTIQENSVLVKLTDRFNGMIPKKELTDEFLKDISEKFSVGDEVEAVVTEFNEKRKSIILSVKKINEMEEKKELEELMKIYGV